MKINEYKMRDSPMYKVQRQQTSTCCSIIKFTKKMDRSAVRILVVLVVLVLGAFLVVFRDGLASSRLESEVEVVRKLRTIGDKVLGLAILGEEGGSIARFKEANNLCISSNCKTEKHAAFSVSFSALSSCLKPSFS